MRLVLHFLNSQCCIYSLDKHDPLFFVSFQGLLQSLDLPKPLFKKLNTFLAAVFEKNITLVILLSVTTHSAGPIHRMGGLRVGLGCCWCVGGRVRG